MNKSAREMFEELGFKKTNSNLLTYRSEDGGYIEQIMFSEVGHRIIFREWEEYNDYQPQGQFTVYTDLLQAINQQCKELGWLDE